MWLESESKWINIKTIYPNYSDLVLEWESLMSFSNKNSVSIEKQLSFKNIFKDHRYQILEVVADGLDYENIWFIEKLIESFLCWEGHEEINYYIYNFKFDISPTNKFIKINDLNEEDKKSEFIFLFLKSFENFILKEWFKYLPNIKNWKLLFYIDWNIWKFKFEYDISDYNREGVIYSVLDEKEKNQHSVYRLLEEYENNDENDVKTEYNYYVEWLFTDLFDIITYDKDITWLEISKWVFSQDFLEIKKFIKENEKYFWINNIIFSLIVISLISFLDNNNFYNIESFEKRMNKELKNKWIDYIVYDENFYTFMKEELHIVFNKL